MRNHDQDLAQAFDSQAAKFEVAPVQSDPVALATLVAQPTCRRDASCSTPAVGRDW